jgi:hypothetical protein
MEIGSCSPYSLGPTQNLASFIQSYNFITHKESSMHTKVEQYNEFPYTFISHICNNYPSDIFPTVLRTFPGFFEINSSILFLHVYISECISKR